MNMYSLLRHETASAWMAWDCAVSLRDRSFRQRGRAREVDNGTGGVMCAGVSVFGLLRKARLNRLSSCRQR